MINHVFICFSAVQIYDLSYIHLQCEKKFTRRQELNMTSTCRTHEKGKHPAKKKRKGSC